MRKPSIVVPLAVSLSAALLSSVEAQVRERPPVRRTQASSETSALATGWTALADGRVDAAVRAADGVLAKRPWDHSALQLKIEALSSADPMRALDTYERWVARRAEDVGLLVPIARSVLRQIAATADPDLARAAIRALQAAGFPTAAAAAQDSATAEQGGSTTAAQLIQTTQDPNPVTRAEAAKALGAVKTEEARATLQKMMQDENPLVRMSAGVALAKLGDPVGQEAVQTMLASNIPDLQLAAAEAWEGKPGPWVAAVTPLLDNRDGVNRLRAARLIAPIDPEAARRVLADALTDPNPVVQSESAKVIAETVPLQPSVADVEQLRKMLRVADAAIRLPAASALLALARTGGV